MPRLARQDPALETVNMGQGGYGFGQAYLGYKRDGVRLNHQVHVFAFISDDFRRMASASFLGYAKPWLALQGEHLVVRNTPVPRGSYGTWSWLIRNAPLLEGLRSVTLVTMLAGRLHGGAAGSGPQDWSSGGQHAIVTAVLQHLTEEHHAHHRRFVAVYLPTVYELAGQRQGDWGTFFPEAARRLGFEYVDLFPAFEALSPDERAAEFIGRHEISFAGAAEHYTPAGNALVARLLHQALAAPPPS